MLTASPTLRMDIRRYSLENVLWLPAPEPKALNRSAKLRFLIICEYKAPVLSQG